jgi:hypothetical protein
MPGERPVFRAVTARAPRRRIPEQANTVVNDTAGNPDQREEPPAAFHTAGRLSV